MNILKKSLAIIAYLLVITTFTKFRIVDLFDAKQIAVTCFGAYLLYASTNGFSVKKNLPLLGQTAVIASYIQVFVLIFFQVSNTKEIENLVEEIAYNCRPLLYGFVLWIVLQGNGSTKKEEILLLEKKELSLEGMRILLKQWNLTNREVEIALEVSKGMSNAEIAYELSISETTVKKHLSNIFEKMDLNKREQIKEKLYQRFVNNGL